LSGGHRRHFIPAAGYRFTVTLLNRSSPLLVDRIFELKDAMIVLPDYIHAIWSLPPVLVGGGRDYIFYDYFYVVIFSVYMPMATGNSTPYIKPIKHKQGRSCRDALW